MEVVIRILCLGCGYIFGLFQTGYIYGRLNGIDIRTQGSGNAGTTNALRVLGKKAGFIVFFGDFFKGFLACFIARMVAGAIDRPDLTYVMMLSAGLGVVLGHNFPCYLKFKGGKGIAATAGVVVGTLEWKIIIPCLIFFILTVAISRYVSLGSLVAVTTLFVLFILCGQMGWLGIDSAPAMIRYESYVWVFLFMALAYVRHKENIVRLVKGEEHKLWGEKKKEEN